MTMQRHPSIEDKRFTTGDGAISYFRTSNPQCPYDILFIHGLGADKAWFPDQFESYSLRGHSWLVPDLLGFGESDKPMHQEAYSMENQAKMLEALVIEEGI
jgi:pimeloyl-ACP methyl ester carboxylesterase